MKKTPLIKKLTLFTLLGIFVSVNCLFAPHFAQAALSSDMKERLDAIAAGFASTADISEAINHLFNRQANPVSPTTVKDTTSVPSVKNTDSLRASTKATVDSIKADEGTLGKQSGRTRIGEGRGFTLSGTANGDYIYLSTYEGAMNAKYRELVPVVDGKWEKKFPDGIYVCYSTQTARSHNISFRVHQAKDYRYQIDNGAAAFSGGARYKMYETLARSEVLTILNSSGDDRSSDGGILCTHKIYKENSANSTSVVTTTSGGNTTKVPAAFASISGPALGSDGKVRWATTHPTNSTAYAAHMRIGTQSASKCEDVSSHIVRGGKAYLPSTDKNSSGSRIKTTFSYDEDTLGEDTKYYYCFTLTTSGGTILASSAVSSFTVSEIKYISQTVNPPVLTASDTSVQSGEKVTLTYDTNGLSGCTLNGGGFSPTVSGAGSRTWTADKTTTFKLQCTGGWATAAVSVGGVAPASAGSTSSGPTTITTVANSGPASVTLTTPMTQKASNGFALISGTSVGMASVKVVYAPSGVSGGTCTRTPSGDKGWWSCIFTANTNVGNTTSKAEISIYGTPTTGGGTSVQQHKLVFD